MGAIDDSTLQHAWNTGTVTGNQKVGGIVGQALGSSIRHAVWKSGSAGQAVGASSNGADVTTDVKFAAEADMKLAATYTDWKDANGTALVATEGGKGTPWRIYEGKTMPLLTALMKGTKRLAKVYDGNVFATTDPHITLVHPGKDVGTYDAYSDQFGYDLIGGAVIKPRVLTLDLVRGTRFDKTYDGNANVTQSLRKGTNYSLTGFITGEGTGIELNAVTGKYADKNAARDKAVTFGGLTLKGTGAGNYVLNRTSLAGVGTISRRALTLALTGDVRFDKTYDGNANATQMLTKGTNYTLTNFADGEGAGIALNSVTGTYADKNAAADKAVTFGGLTLTGTGAGNYRLNTATLTGTGTIAHRDLTLTADAQSIVQGEVLPSFTGRVDGFADGEDERVFGTDGITFGTTVTNTDTPGSYGITGHIGSMSGGVLGNYRIGQAAGNATAFTIHAAALPGGLIASLVQDAAPRFDTGVDKTVYVFGTPRPIRAAMLGLYRFATARDISIEGVRLD